MVIAIIGLLCSCATHNFSLETVRAGFQFKRPNIYNLDTSGVVMKGNTKGALINTPSRKIITTCTHTGPRSGSIVYFQDGIGGLIERKVVKVYNIDVPIYNYPGENFGPDAKPNYQNFFKSDISVCVLEEPAPAQATAYNIAYKTKDYEWAYSTHKNGDIDTFTCELRDDAAIVLRENYTRHAEAGDSGMPWFNTKNEVIATTTLIWQGWAALYSHPFVYGELTRVINEAEQFAVNQRK